MIARRKVGKAKKKRRERRREREKGNRRDAEQTTRGGRISPNGNRANESLPVNPTALANRRGGRAGGGGGAGPTGWAEEGGNFVIGKFGLEESR